MVYGGSDLAVWYAAYLEAKKDLAAKLDSLPLTREERYALSIEKGKVEVDNETRLDIEAKNFRFEKNMSQLSVIRAAVDFGIPFAVGLVSIFFLFRG